MDVFGWPLFHLKNKTFGGGFGQAASSLWTSASMFRNGGDHYDPHLVQLLCKKSEMMCVQVDCRGSGTVRGVQSLFLGCFSGW